MRRCTNQACFAHDGEQCADGKHDISECPSWAQAPAGSEETLVRPVNNDSRVPWSGSALGLSDLANLLPRGRSIVIGVLGAHDAGKTTLLTANYLQLHRGAAPAGWDFAGSRTLGAWEGLADYMRFDEESCSISFPPHTPRGTSRVPGLLHLALRGPDDELRDVLLTDAPGEWFTSWSMNENAATAAGARWVVRRADAFLVLADCERLSGENRGAARRATRELVERLGNHIGKRPCAVVWAKDDCVVPDGIRSAIRTAVQQQLPHAIEMGTSVQRPESFVGVLDAVLRANWLPAPCAPIREPVIEHQPFSAFRGFHAPT